jgi:myo-inositol-1(or 4)-monophosphatase
MDALSRSEFTGELETGLEAARKAGRIMDRYREKGSEIAGRKDGLHDIVTEADLKCQEKIVEEISEEFPEDGFKGEERDLTPDEDTERVWIIDPIDGTTNYFSGWSYFCSSIGLRINGEHVLGVVHSPASGLGKTWAGIKDLGSYLIENSGEYDPQRLKVSEREELESGFLTCFQSPDNDERRSIEQELVEKCIEKGMNYRECASGALMLPEIAEGGLDARLDFVNEWDYAAARVILEEAGGKFEKIGERFGKDTVISTNGKIHGEFRELVRETLSNH